MSIELTSAMNYSHMFDLIHVCANRYLSEIFSLVHKPSYDSESSRHSFLENRLHLHTTVSELIS